MKDYKEEDFEVLRKELGRGYVHILQDRVRKPDGSKYSETYIKNSLTARKVKEVILEAALALRDEKREKRLESIQRLRKRPVRA